MMFLDFNLINHYSVSALIIIVLYFLVIISSRQLIKKTTKKTNVLLCIIYLFIWIIVPKIPVHNLFRFDTPVKAYKYYYPSAKILKEYNFGDYSFIIAGGDKKILPLNACIKKGDSWYFSKTTKTIYNPKKPKKYFLQINQKVQKNITAIAIDYHESLGEKLNVIDSIGSIFETFTYKTSPFDKFYIHIAIIDQELDEDYVLTVDGEDYKPFE